MKRITEEIQILDRGPRQETGARDLVAEDHKIQGLEAYGQWNLDIEVSLLGKKTLGFISQDQLDKGIRVRNEEES